MERLSGIQTLVAHQSVPCSISWSARLVSKRLCHIITKQMLPGFGRDMKTVVGCWK